jgi:lipoate-protein ligase A
MRLITDDNVSASFGLAADETLALRAGTGESPPTLRLYTYRSHCALVGRFQRIENEIRTDYCREHDISINRRPTGGGAIIMGGDQLGIALAMPGRSENAYGNARTLMAQFAEGLLKALHTLGIEAAFRNKNDLEVKGRKIAGLGIHRTPTGGLLFHASLLVDLDVELMLRVLATPFEKLSDKHITTVAARTSTVRRETGSSISTDEVRQYVASGYAAAFGAEVLPSGFLPDELTAIAKLEKDKYLSPEWIFQTTQVADSSGVARIKTSGGLLEVRVVLAGRTLKAVSINGDFFTSEDAVADLERSLRWHVVEPDSLTATVLNVFSRWEEELRMIPVEKLLAAIHRATNDARARLESNQPYGCFVNPHPEQAYA